MIANPVSILAQRALSPMPTPARDTSVFAPAFEQFNGVAIRVYRTADEALVVVPAQPGQPQGLSAQLAASNLRDVLRDERAQQRGFVSLPYLLRETKDRANDFGEVLGIELRDNITSPRRALADLVLDAMAWVSFPFERIRFSSLSVGQLAQMQTAAPKARLALMTSNISPDVVAPAQDRLGSNLVAVHAEIRSIRQSQIEVINRAGVALGSWAQREQNPLASAEYGGAALRFVRMARQLNQPAVMATAFPAQLQSLKLQAG